MLESDSHDSPVTLLDDSDTDVKSKKDSDREDFKTIYRPVKAVVFGDVPVNEVAVQTIYPYLERSSYK